MAHSTVSICNLALLAMGHNKPIQAIDEASVEAGLFSQWFDQCRDEVLALHDWGFAEKVAALASYGTADSDYTYKYQYPADCIRARFIMPVTRTDTPIVFKIRADNDLQGRVIVTDKAEAYLVYTAQMTIVSAFTTHFVNILAYNMAAKLAEPVTKDKEVVQRVTGVYSHMAAIARTVDASEGVGDDNPDADWITGRL